MRVLITGAGRGIGRGLAEAYAAAGHEVHGTARSAPEAPEAPGIAWHVLDVRDRAAHAALAGLTSLDLLICNAGVYPDKGGAERTQAAWSDGLMTNVAGPFFAVEACRPALCAARGRVAIISSAMGSSARAPGGSYIYRASKAAATNLAANLATDLAADGVAVAAFHPGWVRTDMGGGAADVSVADSVAGLMRQIDAMAPGPAPLRAFDGAIVAF